MHSKVVLFFLGGGGWGGGGGGGKGWGITCYIQTEASFVNIYILLFV